MSSAISGASGASGVQAGAFGSIASEDFINIMIEELSNQDPLAPQDSSKLLDQLSSLRNIESQLSLQQSIETLVLQNQVSSASGMIGKVVTGLTEGNDRVSGLVSSVRVVDGEAILELDNGYTLSMNRVAEIANLPADSATAGIE